MAIKHIGFDIETLDITPRAVVLSIACCAFSFEEQDVGYEFYKETGLYIKLNVVEQIKAKRTVGKATVEWWKMQSPDAIAVTKPSDMDIGVEEALRRITEYIRNSEYDWKTSYIWTRGLNFDIPIIEDLFRTSNTFGDKDLPYNTWMTRDIRTYIDVLTGSTNGKYTLVDSKPPKSVVTHSALDDICMDILRMKEIYNKVYGGED